VGWQERYLARFYDRERGWVDGTTEFHQLCEAAIGREKLILEVGAGPSNPTSRFLATLGKVHGLDPDPLVLENDALASARVLEGDTFPYGDGVFDACASNFVAEHVQRPVIHLREVWRVLRPGGVHVFRTANRRHYVGLMASLTPYWVHRRVANRLRNLGPEARPPYPTVYALNTPGRVKRLAGQAGFQVEALRLVEKDPSYGMSSRALFLAFTAYERLVNATPLGAGFRANIFAVLRKPA